MTKVEKLRLQTERNQRKIAKKKAGYFGIWYRKALKFVKKRIKERSKEGIPSVRIENDHLRSLVSWDIYSSVDVDELMAKIAENLREDGFKVIHHPYEHNLISGNIIIDWREE